MWTNEDGQSQNPCHMAVIFTTSRRGRLDTCAKGIFMSLTTTPR